MWIEPLNRNKALDLIFQCLSEGQRKVSVAESLTGGRLQAHLSETSGCSTYFAGGMTAYNIQAKCRVLKVDAEMALGCNCVSVLVATQMAQGVAELFNTHYALATTGYAEPDLMLGIEVPFAHYAILGGGHHLLTGTVKGPGLNRRDMQSLVTTRVLCEFAALLEAGGEHEPA